MRGQKKKRENSIFELTAKLILYAMIFVMLLMAARMVIGKYFVEHFPQYMDFYKVIFADDSYFSAYLNKDLEAGEATGWAALYPFEETDADEEADAGTGSVFGWEYFWDEGFLFYDLLVDWGNRLETGMHWAVNSQNLTRDFVINGKTTGSVYGLGDNYFVECAVRYDVEYAGSRIVEFENSLSEQGIPYLYVQAPGKISPYGDVVLPDNLQDYSNENCDNLLELFRENDVEYLDLREAFHDTGEDYRSYFYGTDHHWNSFGALLGAAEVDKWIAEHYGYTYSDELFNLSNYTITEYEDAFLGTYRNSETNWESFYLVEPAFDTEFEVLNPLTEECARGDFDSSFNRIGIGEGETTEDISYYRFGVDGTMTIVRNQNAENHLRVLVLTDSYGVPFSAYLALGVEEVIVLDNRYFDGSIQSVIAQHEPDLVLQINAITSIANPEVATINNGLWDFK